MLDYFKKLFAEHPKIRKVVGVILVLVGIVSILTPFTPVGFLFVLGLEMLGIRFLLWDKFKKWFKSE